MKVFVCVLIYVLSFNLFSQEVIEEFVPIMVEEKEAFISTKTGEYVFKIHNETDATQLKTTESGVIYTDIKTHTIKKGETLSSIAKKHSLSIDELKRQNDLSKSNLSIGQELKIVKKLIVKSSSPIIGYDGEERIIAKLRPGQTPASLNAPKVNLTEERQISESIQKEEAATEDNIEKLEEPSPKGDSKSYYIVKKGDTLYSISKTHNITILDLKKINSLTSNNLKIGQKLLVAQK